MTDVSDQEINIDEVAAEVPIITEGALLIHETTIDNEGNERFIYSFNTKEDHPVKVIFYSPDDLAFCPSATKEREVFIFGEPPRRRSTLEWTDFINQGKNKPSAKGEVLTPQKTPISDQLALGNSLFFVEATPFSLLRFALAIGVDNPDLRELIFQSEERGYNQRFYDFLDNIIAGKVLDDIGQLQTRQNYQGEALMVLALQENRQAIELLEKRKKELDGKDKEYKNMVEELPKSPESSPELELKDLIGVHLTQYLPAKENEHYMLSTTYDATKGKEPLNTIHFSLNRPVSSEWIPYHETAEDQTPAFALIVPLDKLVAKNGSPDVIAPSDTYYELSPGSTLALPDESLIVLPGELDSGMIVQRDNGNLKYKNRNIQPEDVAILDKTLSDYSRNVLNACIKADISRFFQDNAAIDIGQEKVMRLIGLSNDSAYEVFEKFTRLPIIEVVNDILDDVGLAGDIPPNAREQLVAIIEVQLGNTIREHAIKTAIHTFTVEGNKLDDEWNQGYPEWVYKSIANLGRKLGIKTNLSHVDDPNTSPKIMLKDFFEEINGRPLKDFMQRYRQIKDDIRKSVFELSQPTRRMLYLMGVI